MNFNNIEEIYGKSNPYWKIFRIFSPKDKDKGLNRHPQVRNKRGIYAATTILKDSQSQIVRQASRRLMPEDHGCFLEILAFAA